MEDFNIKIKKNIEESIKDMLYYGGAETQKEIVKIVFNLLMKIERDEFLSKNKSFKNEHGEEIKNKGNGFYPRLVKSLTGFFKVKVPRDRIGLFKPVLFQTIEEENEQLHNLALQLYTKGLTTTDIKRLIKNVYQKSMSEQTISNMVNKFAKQIKAWQNKPLEEKYYFIYVDALYTNIRRGDRVSKEAIFIAIGLRNDLKRDVLGVYNMPSESKANWQEVFNDIKKRGVKNTLMVISDELNYIDEVIAKTFPKALHQSCITHKKRNILAEIRKDDRDSVREDLSNLFVLDDKHYKIKDATKKTKEFINKWGKKYPKIKRMLKEENLHKYFNYLHFPHPIQRMIYTTNWVERLNRSVKKTLRVRSSMPTPDSALKLVSAFLMDFEIETYSYPITIFKNHKPTLDDMFLDLIA